MDRTGLEEPVLGTEIAGNPLSIVWSQRWGITWQEHQRRQD